MTLLLTARIFVRAIGTIFFAVAEEPALNAVGIPASEVSVLA